MRPLNAQTKPSSGVQRGRIALMHDKGRRYGTRAQCMVIGPWSTSSFPRLPQVDEE